MKLYLLNPEWDNQFINTNAGSVKYKKLYLQNLKVFQILVGVIFKFPIIMSAFRRQKIVGKDKDSFIQSMLFYKLSRVTFDFWMPN